MKMRLCINMKLTDIMKDYTKSRPNTFAEITFPIYQEVENKIKVKNSNLRKKARARLEEHLKNIKNQEIKEDNPNAPKKEPSPDKPVNYFQAYQLPTRSKENIAHWLQPETVRLDDKDQQLTLQIYLLLKKRKPIFKVQEVKRKLRSKEQNKRFNYKECDCCGKLGGKHKCSHLLCDKKCEYFQKKLEQEPDNQPSNYNEEPESALAMAQQLINGSEVVGEELKTVQIKIKEEKEEDMKIPEIDVIEEENNKNRNEQEEIHEELQGVVETERISEIESKSQVSQSRRNRSDAKDFQSRQKLNQQISPKEQSHKQKEQNIDQ